MPGPSTAADWINQRILRHMVQLRPGYVASPELQQDILTEWIALVAELNAQPDMTTNVPAAVYPITTAGYLGNNRDYTIGPSGADLTGPRPIQILKANLLFTNASPVVRIPLAVLPWRAYGSIPVLAIPPVNVATELYYEPGFPNGIIHLWPPLTGQSLEFWTEGVLVAPPTLATIIGTPTAPVTTIPELFGRTALIQDTTVGNNISPVVTVYATGTATRLTAVLRKAIVADLILRVNLNGVPLITADVPAATPVNTVLSFTGFSTTALTDGQVLSWDILASDGSSDPDGVASFTLNWGPATTVPSVTVSFPPAYENFFVYTLAFRCQYLATKEMGPKNPLLGVWALRAKQVIRNLNRSNPLCRSDFQTRRSGRGAPADIGAFLSGEI